MREVSARLEKEIQQILLKGAAEIDSHNRIGLRIKKKSTSALRPKFAVTFIYDYDTEFTK